MILQKLLALIFMVQLLVGCGYFSDEPVADAGTYRSEKLANSCELDVEELAQILEKDVQKQIDCLEKNLDNFSKYVKRENDRSITGSELEGFVRRFFKGHANIITESMTLIFDINSLFLQDRNESISTENIKPLFNLLRTTNMKISKVMKTIRAHDEGRITLQTGKILIEKDLEDFSDQIKSIISQNGAGVNSKLNLKGFLERIEERFSNIVISPQSLNGLLALKKLFLGGEREVLTRSQLFTLLDRMPKLASTAFSFYYASAKNQGGSVNLYSLFRRSIESLEDQLYPHRREEVIFKEGEVEGLITSFFEKDQELFIEVSRKVKTHILGARSESGPYRYQEIRNISKFSLALIEGLTFYENYKDAVANNKTWDKANWSWKKELFLKHFETFRTFTSKTVNENVYFPNKVDLVSFIKFLSSKFDSFPINHKLADLMTLGKVVMVGGNRNDFTKLEVLNLLDKSRVLSGVFFDLAFSSPDTHSPQDLNYVFYQSLKSIRAQISGQVYQHVTTIRELLRIVSEYMETPEVKTYQSTVEHVKEKLLGGYSTSISVADVKKIMEKAEVFFGKRYFFDITYDVYEDELSSPKKIHYLSYKHTSKYKHFSKDEILVYRKDFIDLVKTFRVYRDKEGVQFYGDAIKRTKEGLLEIHTLKYLLTELGVVFGHKSPRKDAYILSIEELNNLLNTFKPVLEHYGMWSAFPDTFARNTLLLADLFQGRSNGDLSIDPVEATEYATLALFAIQTAEQLIDQMKNYCDWVEGKGAEGFEISCYRKHFFNVLLEDLDYKKSLPKLSQYISEAPEKEVHEFLVAVEGFARESWEEGRPETRKDLVLLIGAILNIESTFLRYDADHSNIIEPSELNVAFPVYEDAVMIVARLEESQRSYAKSIFLYMVKKMKIPSKWEVATFHYNPFTNREISAKRLNIGSLLYNMLLASARAKEQQENEAN